MSKTIDLYNLGKNTFNSCFTQLNNDKKVLSHYSHCIEDYLSLIEENKNQLISINRNMDKYSPIDKPFCLLKKFEIILNIQCQNFDYFLDFSQKSFEHLKESIDSNLSFISGFLSKTKEYSENIKLNSEIFYQKFDKLNNSLEETEQTLIEDYIKNTYKIQLNKDDKDKNKINSLEELVNKSHMDEKEFLESKIIMENLFKTFLTEYNSNMKEIKQKMTKLNEDCKNDLLNVIQTIKDNCNNILTLLNNDTQKIEQFDTKNVNFEKGYNEYLNNEIKQEELFEVINKEKYSIKIINEEEKNKIEMYLNHLNQNNNNKENQNILISVKDIYNIVEKIYSYNFETIKKDEYDLDIEKEKIQILEKTGKLLGYNFYLNEATKKENMSENEINDFINFVISKEEYTIEFLTRINNYRSSGNYELSPDLFLMIKQIFNKAADKLMEKNNSKISNFLIILSQTFYIMIDNNKYFLQKELKKKEFFQNTEFWLNKLDNSIKEEFERFESELISNNINLNEKKKERKKEDILFTIFISSITSLNGFELDKEKIDKIIFPLIDKYNVKEETKKTILSLLDVYKNND